MISIHDIDPLAREAAQKAFPNINLENMSRFQQFLPIFREVCREKGCVVGSVEGIALRRSFSNWWNSELRASRKSAKKSGSPGKTKSKRKKKTKESPPPGGEALLGTDGPKRTKKDSLDDFTKLSSRANSLLSKIREKPRGDEDLLAELKSLRNEIASKLKREGKLYQPLFDQVDTLKKIYELIILCDSGDIDLASRLMEKFESRVRKIENAENFEHIREKVDQLMEVLMFEVKYIRVVIEFGRLTDNRKVEEIERLSSGSNSEKIVAARLRQEMEFNKKIDKFVEGAQGSSNEESLESIDEILKKMDDMLKESLLRRHRRKLESSRIVLQFVRGYYVASGEDSRIMEKIKRGEMEMNKALAKKRIAAWTALIRSLSTSDDSRAAKQAKWKKSAWKDVLKILRVESANLSEAGSESMSSIAEQVKIIASP